MSRFKLDFSSEWASWGFMIFLTIIFAGVMFLINNLTGVFNLLIFIIITIIGLLFGIWYFRLLLVFIKELRKKEPKKLIGVPLGWSIFGLITSLINMIVWGFLSAFSFNFPKIIFLVPSTLALVEIFYIFVKANRRGSRDWVVVIYNILAFWYLFAWTLVDFGVDLPSVLGVLHHTITSDGMWWQIINFNTGAFFSPTFLFPPYMLNPRYYFAMPVEEYLEKRKIEEEEELARARGARERFLKEDLPEEEAKDAQKEEELEEAPPPLTTTIESGELEEKEGDIPEEKKTERRLPGERIPFFEERRKREKQLPSVEVRAIYEEMDKADKERDEKYAKSIGVSDVPLGLQRLTYRLDSLVRISAIYVTIILVLLAPIMLAGNIYMNVLPSYQKLDFAVKPGMTFSVVGSVFTTMDFEGNLTVDWDKRLAEEISWAQELHATHLRYDIKSRMLNNNVTLESMDIGLQRIVDNGINLIICVKGDFSFTRIELINKIYEDASLIAQRYLPDYMIIFNELNGELLNNINEVATINDWIPAINNVSSRINALSPTTKVITTVLASGDGLDYFEQLLNSTVDVDVLGVSFFPFFFGMRTKKLLEFAEAFRNASSSKEFWITEVGMESFNYGEEAQAKFLAKVISMASKTEELNASGVCIFSLRDNTGFTIERGLTSHLGLVYFSGKKKKAFKAVKFAVGKILGMS